jgi:hypothetical protein
MANAKTILTADFLKKSTSDKLTFLKSRLAQTEKNILSTQKRIEEYKYTLKMAGSSIPNKERWRIMREIERQEDFQKDNLVFVADDTALIKKYTIVAAGEARTALLKAEAPKYKAIKEARAAAIAKAEKEIAAEKAAARAAAAKKAKIQQFVKEDYHYITIKQLEDQIKEYDRILKISTISEKQKINAIINRSKTIESLNQWKEFINKEAMKRYKKENPE